MPSKSEIQRRKEITREIAQRERAEAEARMPISKIDLDDLFNHLDIALSTGCDHTLRFTRGFLQTRALDESTIVPWLGEYGGYCDCEVLNNVEETWGET